MSGGYVRPHPDGVEIRLDEELAAFLVQFPFGLDGVRRGADDPAARRLNVPVYLDDRDADQEWWGFMGEELDQGRAADRSAFGEVMAASVAGTVMSAEEARAVLRVLVESRLVYAARLGIDVEEDYERLGPSDASVLDALAELQMALISALE
jgi:hypothetical protein